MAKQISPERLARYREINQTHNSTLNAPPNCRDYLMRMAEEKIDVVRSHNLTYFGFAKAPYSPDIEGADIVVVGMGPDYGTHQETGDMRHAPQYIRFRSKNIVPVNDEWDIAPMEMCRVHDIGDINIQGMDAQDQVKYGMEWVEKIADAGALLLIFGGEHTIAHLAGHHAKMISDRYYDGAPLGGICFDGHADMMTNVDNYMPGSEYNNANFFAKAISEGWLDPERFFMFGMHDWGISVPVGVSAAREFGVRQVRPREVEEKGARYFADMVHEAIGDSPAWLSVDLDGLDTVGAGGGLSARDGFGLMWREYRTLARAMKGLNFVAADISEYAPAKDVNGANGITVANFGFEILCMLTDNKWRLNGGVNHPTQYPIKLSNSPTYFGEDFLDEWKRMKAEGR
ncbi:MAG: arginase family protein [Acidimicrobiia bacterium]|nr:arginase family protein [Acidimicrobiia bacterium]